MSELVWGYEPTPEFAAWRLADSDIAESEHWNVFECSGSDNGPWQIQKVDEADYWGDDTDVDDYRPGDGEGVIVHLYPKGRARHLKRGGFVRPYDFFEPAERSVCITQPQHSKELSHA